MSRGDKFVKNHSRKTIRLLGTVGGQSIQKLGSGIIKLWEVKMPNH